MMAKKAKKVKPAKRGKLSKRTRAKLAFSEHLLKGKKLPTFDHITKSPGKLRDYNHVNVPLTVSQIKFLRACIAQRLDRMAATFSVWNDAQGRYVLFREHPLHVFGTQLLEQLWHVQHDQD